MNAKPHTESAQTHLALLALYARLATNVHEQRTAQAVSLQVLSETAKVDRKFVRQLEAAKLNPTLKTLERVAKALGISIATLLGKPEEAYETSRFTVQTLVAMNIKRLRRSRNWTTADAESRMLMKAAYLGYMETGRGNCTLQTLNRVAQGFGVDVVELLTVPKASGARAESNR